MATFCFADSLETFSYVCVLWIAIPQKRANDSTANLSDDVNDLPSTLSKQSSTQSKDKDAVRSDSKIVWSDYVPC